MSTNIVTPEITAALGQFFSGGSGPSHNILTQVFLRHGFGEIAPYVDGQPNKEDRVRLTVGQAAGSNKARSLLEDLLAELRAAGCFAPDSEASHVTSKVQAAFRRAGWNLSSDGLLSPIASVDLETGGRPALDEQISRLRRSTDDPALLLGSSKDLLESVAKFVLEELGHTPAKRYPKFEQLWYLARDRLGLLPGEPHTEPVKKILGAAWTIASQVNDLRCSDGTGHGRTLPTGVSPELALFAVREACSVAELMLSTLERQLRQ